MEEERNGAKLKQTGYILPKLSQYQSVVKKEKKAIIEEQRNGKTHKTEIHITSIITVNVS